MEGEVLIRVATRVYLAWISLEIWISRLKIIKIKESNLHLALWKRKEQNHAWERSDWIPNNNLWISMKNNLPKWAATKSLQQEIWYIDSQTSTNQRKSSISTLKYSRQCSNKRPEASTIVLNKINRLQPVLMSFQFKTSSPTEASLEILILIWITEPK